MFNVIGTLMIIAIHYQSNRMIPEDLHYHWNYLFQDSIINGFARVAVPGFALASGFFIYSSIQSVTQYIKTMHKKIGTLLIPYLIGSSIIFFLTLLIFNLTDSGIMDSNQMTNPISAIKSIIAHPLSEQFWFVRDLLILSVFSPLILYNRCFVSSILGTALCILWFLEIQPFPIISGWYFINIESLFFFWLGGYVSSKGSFLSSLFEWQRQYKYGTVFLWAALIALRLYIAPDFFVWYNNGYKLFHLIVYKASILVGLLSILFICHKYREAKKIKSLSSYTFFVYLFHFFPLFHLTRLSTKIMPVAYVFYLNFPLAVLITFTLAWLLSRYLPRFYNIICGGRTRKKFYAREEL